MESIKHMINPEQHKESSIYLRSVDISYPSFLRLLLVKCDDQTFSKGSKSSTHSPARQGIRIDLSTVFIEHS